MSLRALATACVVLGVLVWCLPSQRVYIYYTGGLNGCVEWPRPFSVDATQVSRELSRVRRQLESRGQHALLVDVGDSVLGSDPISSEGHGSPVAHLWKAAGMDVVGLGRDDREANRLPQLRALGLPLASADVDGSVPVCVVGDVRVAFVACGDVRQAAALVRHARRTVTADVVILLAAVPRLADLSGCGADAVIPAHLAADASSDAPTHLADGTLVAPFVDGRQSLGCLQIEQRGLTGRRLLHTVVVHDLQRFVAARRSASGGRTDALPPFPPHASAVASALMGVGQVGLTHIPGIFSESPMGDYVTDVMRRASGADVALLNHLAIRNNLEGPIGRNEIWRALPFDDRVVTVDVRGAALREVCRRNALQERGFLQMSGMRTAFSPADSRRVEVWVGAAPLDDAHVYRVAIIDYMLFAPRYALLHASNAYRTSLSLRDAVEDDVESRRVVEVPARRMTVDRVDNGVSSKRTPSSTRSTMLEAPSDVASTALRLPDLSALVKWNLPLARVMLRSAANAAAVDRGESLLWLGYVDYFGGHVAAARTDWRAAARVPTVASKAADLLDIER